MWCYKFLFAALVGLALSAGENQTSTTTSAATPETSTNTLSNNISFATASQSARTTTNSSDSILQKLGITVASNATNATTSSAPYFQATNGSSATSTVTEPSTSNESTFSVNDTASWTAPVAGTTDISTSSVTASNSSTSVPTVSVHRGKVSGDGATPAITASMLPTTSTALLKTNPANTSTTLPKTNPASTSTALLKTNPANTSTALPKTHPANATTTLPKTDPADTSTTPKTNPANTSTTLPKTNPANTTTTPITNPSTTNGNTNPGTLSIPDSKNTTKVHPCESDNPCENGGTCSFNGSVVVCTCTVGWTGYNCTTDFDECVNSTHKCNTNNSVCNNVDGDYTCSCNSGYARGEHNKHCVDFNECASTTHNCTNLEKCVNTVGSFQCECGGNNFYNETVGTCQKMKIEKVEYRIPGNSTVNLDDKTSDSYKNLTKEIERNMTELLIRDNSGGIHRVKVIDLRKGSIIVTAVVQLNTTKALDLPTDYSLMPKQDDDYCLWNQCDLKSTNCRGSANLEDYSCECKDDSFERVEGAYYWCRYKDECRPVTNNCSAPGKECLMQDGIYKCLPSREVSKSDCDDPIYCHNSGTCIQSSDTGKAHCSCADGYMGANCEIKSVKASEVTDLRNILIGVGVGLGSLALFCSIALIIVCCSDRSKSSKATLTSRHYVGDDVTIDTWEPSLPRPKIKPGAFSHSSTDRMEMDERRPHSEREHGAGAENPAFIPEADYESSGRRGRGAPNGKKGASEFVYF